jgi:hypothetical protein
MAVMKQIATAANLYTHEPTAAVSTTGASSHPGDTWHDIKWRKVHQNVRRLQARIVQATKAGKWGKVKALQRLLTHSFSGKALAVKRVTENQGKRTPGVDGQTWSTPAAKTAAIQPRANRGAFVITSPTRATSCTSVTTKWMKRVSVVASNFFTPLPFLSNAMSKFAISPTPMTRTGSLTLNYARNNKCPMIFALAPNSTPSGNLNRVFVPSAVRKSVRILVGILITSAGALWVGPIHSITRFFYILTVTDSYIVGAYPFLNRICPP